MTKSVYPFHNARGEPRRLGIELELAGLDLGQLTDIVAGTAGGTVVKQSDYEATVRGSRVGDVRIEFDAALFRELKVRSIVEGLDPRRWNNADKEALEKAFANMAQWVVPFELVFEPLPFSRLPELEAVRQGAVGIFSPVGILGPGLAKLLNA